MAKKQKKKDLKINDLEEDWGQYCFMGPVVGREVAAQVCDRFRSVYFPFAMDVQDCIFHF